MKRYNILPLVILMALLFSCRKWDDFKKYISNGEITYTGKMDSVKVYSGKERVMLYGLLKSDPKLQKIVILWGNDANSVSFDYTKQYPGIDTFSRTFPVSEGVKSFKVQTFDSEGHKSVNVFAIGTSYGETFRKRLSNRNMVSLDFNDAGGRVSWDQMDMSTGPQFTELLYTNTAGTAVKVVAPVTETTTQLPGLTAGATLKYRTIFRPDATAIDTFASSYREL